MTKESPKLHTWQVFNVARRTLGPGTVANIFGRRNARSAYDWAQDPAYTVQRVKRDPLEALHLMLSMLVERGREDVARCAIEYLGTALEGQLCPPTIKELKATLDAEILADFRAVSDLQEAIEKGLEASQVKTLAIEAKAEIDRTLAKYLMMNIGKEEGG